MSILDTLGTLAHGANAALTTFAALDGDKRKQAAEELNFAIAAGERAHRAGNTVEMAKWAQRVHKGFEILTNGEYKAPKFGTPAGTETPVTAPSTPGYRQQLGPTSQGSPGLPFAQMDPGANGGEWSAMPGDAQPATGFNTTTEETFNDPASRSVFDSLFKSKDEYASEQKLSMATAKYEADAAKQAALAETRTVLKGLEGEQKGYLEGLRQTGRMQVVGAQQAGATTRTGMNNATSVANNENTNDTRVVTTGMNNDTSIANNVNTGNVSRANNTANNATKVSVINQKYAKQDHQTWSGFVSDFKREFPRLAKYITASGIQPNGHAPNGFHPLGVAIDFDHIAAMMNPVERQAFNNFWSSRNVQVDDETKKNNPNWTGPHLHLRPAPGVEILSPAQAAALSRAGAKAATDATKIKLTTDKTGKRVKDEVGVDTGRVPATPKPSTTPNIRNRETFYKDAMHGKVPVTPEEDKEWKAAEYKPAMAPRSLKDKWSAYADAEMAKASAGPTSDPNEALNRLTDAMEAARKGRK